MKRFIADRSALFMLAALCLALGWYVPEFCIAANVQNVALGAAVLGMIALGQLLVIITGGIDLSVGAVAALAGVAGCLSMLRVQAWLSSELVHGWMMKLPHAVEPFMTGSVFPALVFAAGIAVGALVGFGCGLINGLFSAKGRVQPFLVTLCMMLAARGLAMVISERQPVSGLPGLFSWLGGTQAWWIPAVIACVFGALFALLLVWTQFGRNLYAVGGNAEAARLSGIPVARVRTAAFALSGTMAGFAGMMLASRIGVGAPDAADLFELDATAACVMGGASLWGGAGGAVTVLAGALVMSALHNFCNLKNISPDGQRVLLGALLVSLACFDAWRQRRAGLLKD